jgi:hypothetical protein
MEMPKGWMRERNFRQWFLMHLIAKFDLGVVGELKKDEDDKEIDVVLSINGHEIDALKAIDEIERQHERMVKEDAEEIVAGKIRDILGPFEDTIADAQKLIAERCGLSNFEEDG